MIGLLNAYRLSEEAPQYQLDYEPMMLKFLKAQFPDETVRVYRVALGEIPKSTQECQMWLISGSPKGAYEQDGWILALGKFVQECHKQKVKLVGICFGHQIIAHYLGGKTEKSPAGWGVGVQNFLIKKIMPWMKPSLSQANLLFSHQDQVVQLPKDAELIATSDFCKNQMFSIGQHIFCMQGHPEFTSDFARGRLDSRKDIVGKTVYDQGIQSLTKPTQANEVGSWISAFRKI